LLGTLAELVLVLVGALAGAGEWWDPFPELFGLGRLLCFCWLGGCLVGWLFAAGGLGALLGGGLEAGGRPPPELP
jgi:hypothetical protein